MFTCCNVMVCRKSRQSQNQAGNQEPQNADEPPVTSAYMNPDPYDVIPDHMVYSTQAHNEKKTDSTYYTEPYADVASPQKGVARYYNTPEKPKARNSDYENSPNQPEVPAQESSNYEYVSAGYEELKRVEYENTKDRNKNKVYDALKKNWIALNDPIQTKLILDTESWTTKSRPYFPKNSKTFLHTICLQTSKEIMGKRNNWFAMRSTQFRNQKVSVTCKKTPNFPKNQKWALHGNSFGGTPKVIEKQMYGSRMAHQNKQNKFCEYLKQNNGHLQIHVCNFTHCLEDQHCFTSENLSSTGENNSWAAWYLVASETTSSYWCCTADLVHTCHQEKNA